MFQELSRFLAMKRDERTTLVLAFLLSAIIRVGIAIMPFRIVKDLPSRAFRYKGFMKDYMCKEKIGWSVQVSSNYIPKTTCLSRALTAQIMLSLTGQPSNLHIGVMKSNQNVLEGHAWLEYDGAIVIGDLNIDQYKILESI